MVLVLNPTKIFNQGEKPLFDVLKENVGYCLSPVPFPSVVKRRDVLIELAEKKQSSQILFLDYVVGASID